MSTTAPAPAPLDLPAQYAHGDLPTYTNQKCRCAACRNAMRVYQNGRRERIRAKAAKQAAAAKVAA